MSASSASLLGVARAASGMLAVAVLSFGAMTFKVVREGNAALEASDAAFDRGALEDAVLHARRAATLYAPGAPHTRAALERLRAVAVGSEASGDRATARLAWGAIRAAALETRHVTVPYEAELAEANRRLERLFVLGTPVPDRGRVQASVRQQLALVPGPPAWASLLLVAGFALAAGGLGFVAIAGLTREGRVIRRRFGYGVLAFVAGAVLWAIAVYRA